jgi:NAD(P)-dependent dehydrogenase (short-subunit alcohol dehydrogenase family)
MTPSLRDNLDADLVEQIRRHNALPFIGEPEDVAAVVLFLASAESRYVTGQVITVDGGLMSHSPIAESRRRPAFAG